MNEQHTRLHMTGAVKRKQIFKTLRRQKLIQNSFARLVWEWFFALQQQMTAWALKSSLDKAQPIFMIYQSLNFEACLEKKLLLPLLGRLELVN